MQQRGLAGAAHQRDLRGTPGLEPGQVAAELDLVAEALFGQHDDRLAGQRFALPVAQAGGGNRVGAAGWVGVFGEAPFVERPAFGKAALGEEQLAEVHPGPGKVRLQGQGLAETGLGFGLPVQVGEQHAEVGVGAGGIRLVGEGLAVGGFGGVGVAQAFEGDAEVVAGRGIARVERDEALQTVGGTRVIAQLQRALGGDFQQRGGVAGEGHPHAGDAQGVGRGTVEQALRGLRHEGVIHARSFYKTNNIVRLLIVVNAGFGVLGRIDSPALKPE